MDTKKVNAVRQGPLPTTVNELQCFLCFENFYWRFIRNYSIIASPITSLLKGSPQKLQWTTQAEDAFNNLNMAFTTATILQHPNSELPFVVEVDASDYGFGTILSQRTGTKHKPHPMASFSLLYTSILYSKSSNVSSRTHSYTILVS